MVHTNHIYLGQLKLEDTESLYTFWIQNKEFLVPFNPKRPDFYFTFEEQQQKIAKENQDWENDLAYGFGIFLREANQLIGRVNLSNVVRGAWQNCTIGYFIAEEMQGQGYMTDAVRLAVKFAFEQVDLHRVQAGVMPRNVGSIRVLEKVGFLYEGLSKYHVQINGVWEDHKIFAITKEIWDEKGIME